MELVRYGAYSPQIMNALNGQEVEHRPALRFMSSKAEAIDMAAGTLEGVVLRAYLNDTEIGETRILEAFTIQAAFNHKIGSAYKAASNIAIINEDMRHESTIELASLPPLMRGQLLDHYKEENRNQLDADEDFTEKLAEYSSYEAYMALIGPIEVDQEFDTDQAIVAGDRMNEALQSLGNTFAGKLFSDLRHIANTPNYSVRAIRELGEQVLAPYLGVPLDEIQYVASPPIEVVNHMLTEMTASDESLNAKEAEQSMRGYFRATMPGYEPKVRLLQHEDVMALLVTDHMNTYLYAAPTEAYKLSIERQHDNNVVVLEDHRKEAPQQNRGQQEGRSDSSQKADNKSLSHDAKTPLATTDGPAVQPPLVEAGYIEETKRGKKVYTFENDAGSEILTARPTLHEENKYELWSFPYDSSQAPFRIESALEVDELITLTTERTLEQSPPGMEM